MSEFTKTKEKRLEKLKEVSRMILETGNAHAFVVANKDFIPTVIPSDFICLFDEVVQEKSTIDDIKLLSNKILNIFFEPISQFSRLEPKAETFLALMEDNNKEMELLLNRIRPVFKAYVKNLENKDIKTGLKHQFRKLEQFTQHYTLKENILFPSIEKHWPDYRCLKIMWSFHDDIRRNIKMISEQLASEKLDFKVFNRAVGDVFFNMKAIKYREERILFPHVLLTISEQELEAMGLEAYEMGYPYIQPQKPQTKGKKAKDQIDTKEGKVNLGTGILNVEQIKMIFNHLPVDITYVDENDMVLYFSTPPKRIFPRTTAIIGREVSNCHPPESVHIVEQIVDSFKKGEKDKAQFWIKIMGEFVFIQYFAVRDEQGAYRGVIEVSQEISEIKGLEGEQRLLDW